MSTPPTGGDATVTQSTSAYDNPTYQKYVLCMLVLGYIFNVLDRQVLSSVLQPLQDELDITSDALLGLLSGAAFSIAYSFMGVPIARLADRWNRVNVLAIAIGLWSVSTAACGLAWNYVSLFAWRTSTAIGEAGGSPPSHSLISDYFKPAQRATALAVYAMAVPVGTSIGAFVSGWSNVYFGWRWTFAIIGLPGLLVALVIWLTIKEPPRGYSDGKPRLPMPRFLDVFRFLLTRNSFMHMSLAAALHSVVWYSGTSWNNGFFVRSHELNTGQAGTYIAVFSLLGAVGSFAGGYLSDRLSIKTNDKRWYMWVPGIACVIMVPIQFAAYMSTDLMLTVPLAFSAMFMFASMFFGPSFAVAQSVATVPMRAVSASVLLFIQTIIGMTAGPFLVGVISDLLAPAVGQLSLGYAMALIGVVNLWAAVHYFLGARRYREDLAATAQLNAASQV